MSYFSKQSALKTGSPSCLFRGWGLLRSLCLKKIRKGRGWAENMLIFSGHLFLQGKINCFLHDTQVCSFDLVSESVKVGCWNASKQPVRLAPKQPKKEINYDHLGIENGHLPNHTRCESGSVVSMSAFMQTLQEVKCYIFSPKYFVYFHVRKKKCVIY